MVQVARPPQHGKMTGTDIAYHARWKPSSGHPGGWRVTRKDYVAGTPLEELIGKTGGVILFGSYESANRRADALNAATGEG